MGKRFLPIVFVLIIGLALSALSFYAFLEYGRTKFVADFNQKASDRLAAVERTIATELAIVDTLVAHLTVEEKKNRRNFGRLVRLSSGSDGNTSHQALEWIPRVGNGERDRFVADARADGFAEFDFMERSSDGKMVPARARDVYYPVFYVEPYVGNEEALGFDLASNPVRLATLEKSRDTGRPVASSRINLVQAKEDPAGILLFAPIFGGDTIPTTVAERRRLLNGFALGVFRVSKLIASAFRSDVVRSSVRNPAGIDIHIFDLSDTATTEALYTHSSRSRSDRAPALSLAQARSGFSVEHTMMVGGRSWAVIARPVTSRIDTVWWWTGAGASTGILVVTLLLAVYLFAAANRERQIRRTVDIRTKELRDATERSQQNEARVAAIVNTVVDGIVTIDERGRILSVNPAFEQIFGYTEKELLGLGVTQLMPAEDAEQEEELIRNYRESRAEGFIGIGRETRGLRKDGSVFPMELGVSESFDEEGIRFTGVVRDITERKQAETLKSEFVSTVSHELRTPLTSIKGSLGLIKAGVVGELPGKLKSMLDIAYNNSDRLVLLINDILDIEKIEAGKMDFKYAAVNLAALLEDAIVANQGYARETEVEYRIVESVSDSFIQGDVDRLMQVMSNLLSNAAKFSQPGSVIELSLSELGDHYRVSVRDFGSGVPEEFRDNIFKKFSQADSSDTRQQGGTGLGLSICKAIVEKHKGDIGFDSVIGEGSTFHFDIPKPVKVRKGRRVGEVPRILVCETEPDIAAVITGILETGGYETEVAPTAMAAKNLLAEKSFSGMTLDLMLPDQDGRSLLKEIRNERETAGLTIVVVSSQLFSDIDDFNDEALERVDWIEKPIDQDRLLAALTAMIRRQSTARPRVLHVEDDFDLSAVTTAVAGEFCDIETVGTLRGAQELLARGGYNLVILDLMLPDGDGAELLDHARDEDGGPIPVIVFSAKEVSSEWASPVKAVFVKSQTSNEELLAAVKSVINA